jgi:HSP20 family molecular chaperone IbpA
MVEKNKVSHPVDLYETEKGLNFDIACTGISKDEIDIQLNGDILKVNYDRIEDDNKDYIYKGIAKRSFNLGWKINSRFDVSKSIAGFNDGLLTITVPFAKGSEIRTLKIK